MRRLVWVLATVAAVCAIMAFGVATAEYWLFLWDGAGHRGVFRCSATQRPSGDRVRECYAGADELLLREISMSNGTMTRSWFTEGIAESHREVIGGGSRRILTRRFADCWYSNAVGASPPEVPSGISCP